MQTLPHNYDPKHADFYTKVLTTLRNRIFRRRLLLNNLVISARLHSLEDSLNPTSAGSRPNDCDTRA